MKEIGKITVKHFVNKNLGAKNDIISTSINGKVITYPKVYPLYVKITFMRKSTEVKSILDDNFESVEEAKYKHGLLLAAESSMIEHFVAKAFKIQGDKFSLKGIALICRNYHNKKICDLFDNFLFNEFNNYLQKSSPKYWLLLSNRIPSVSSYTYFEAALTLLNNDVSLLKFKKKFEIIRDIESISFAGFGELQNQPLVFWQFGQVKDMFMLEASTKRFSKQRVENIVIAIETEIIKLSF